MMPDTSVLVASTTGAWPVTVSDSWTPCNCIVMLCVTSRPIVSVMSFRSTTEKPPSSAFTSYRPGASPAMRYRPSASLTVARTTPVSAFRAVSVTPGSTPLWTSETTPTMAPPVVCAYAGTTTAGPIVSAAVSPMRNDENDGRSLRSITPP